MFVFKCLTYCYINFKIAQLGMQTGLVINSTKGFVLVYFPLFFVC